MDTPNPNQLGSCTRTTRLANCIDLALSQPGADLAREAWQQSQGMRRGFNQDSFERAFLTVWSASA